MRAPRAVIGGLSNLRGLPNIPNISNVPDMPGGSGSPRSSCSGFLASLDRAWNAHLVPREPDAPTVVSTFAGCGGSSLGYSMAGYRELLAAEWNGSAAATFCPNFPQVPVYPGDIIHLSVEQALQMAGLRPGELDVLDGSPPCQGFSTAGRRLMDDPRNSLFREYVRLLQGLQPKVFVMENVAGMVRGKMKLLFVEIFRELKASGYLVSARMMNTMYFGVPQSRERMIFVGVRSDLAIQPSHPRAQTRPISVMEAIGDLPATQDPDIDHVWVEERGRTRTYALAERARQGQKYAGHQKRDRWHRPASTLTTSGTISKPYLRGLNCHPLYTRTYSAREYARLSSFPDRFNFIDPWSLYKQVGNSVPPLFMRAIASHIHKELLSHCDLNRDRGEQQQHA